MTDHLQTVTVRFVAVQAARDVATGSGRGLDGYAVFFRKKMPVIDLAQQLKHEAQVVKRRARTANKAWESRY